MSRVGVSRHQVATGAMSSVEVRPVGKQENGDAVPCRRSRDGGCGELTTALVVSLELYRLERGLVASMHLLTHGGQVSQLARARSRNRIASESRKTVRLELCTHANVPDNATCTANGRRCRHKSETRCAGGGRLEILRLLAHILA